MASDEGLTIALLCFPRVSTSIRCSSEQRTATLAAIDRLRRILLPIELMIGAIDRYLAPEIRDLPIDFHSNIYLTSVDKPLLQIYEGFSASGADRAIICDLGTCAIEPHWMASLVRKHISSDSWLSSVIGLPDGVAPLIVDRQLVELAMSVPFQQGRFPLKPILQQCISVARQSGYPTASSLEVPFSDIHGDESALALPARFEPTKHHLVGRSTDFEFGDVLTGIDLLKRWRDVDDNTVVHWPRWRTARKGGSLRILYVSNPSGYSGAEEALCTTLLSLKHAKIQASCLIGLDGHFADTLRGLGAEVTVVGSDFSYPSALNASIISGAIDRLHPDIVHINSPSGPLVNMLAHLSGAKVVEHLRLTKFKAELDSLQHADVVVAVSKYVEELAWREGVPRKRLKVLYDALNETRFAPVTSDDRAKAKMRLGIPTWKLVIVMVARFVPSKRHEILLRAVKLLPKDFAVVVMVGESLEAGDYEAYIDNLIDKLDLQDQIIRLGFQPEIESIHAAADIAVLCSIDEPLGMAVLEAMSMAIPAIICGGSGLSEIVDSSCGSVVESDESSLAESIFRIGSDAILRDQMGVMAKHRVTTICCAENHSQALLKIYDEVLKDRC